MQGQKIVIILLVGAFYVKESTSSSIPMFEFLTRDEKVRKLFREKFYMNVTDENLF